MKKDISDEDAALTPFCLCTADNPEAPEKQEHRQYLKEQVLFKEAVPIRDPNTLSKIHQTYRIGYIKDVILPRALDDQTFGTLNSLMLFNHVEVISSLQVGSMEAPSIAA
jgi:protein phosphatase-4 regulatory subunit 3